MSKQYSTQNSLLLDNLLKFYEKNNNIDKILKIINGESTISLRLIDWFVTNYSKKHFVIYNIKKNNKDKRFNVYIDYKLKLKAYSKKRFDPFCRRNRIKFQCQGKEIDTTIGQLNFFKWAINNLIVDYISIYKDKIEYDMNTCLKQMKLQGSLMKKEGKRKKRQELSLSATRGLSRNNVLVRLEFD